MALGVSDVGMRSSLSAEGTYPGHYPKFEIPQTPVSKLKGPTCSNLLILQKHPCLLTFSQNP